MKVIAEYGREELAKVYVAQMRGTAIPKDAGKFTVEFVESLQPPLPREKKWVIIVSSLFGCPIRCGMCDAGGMYSGKLTSEEILQQIDYIVARRYPDRRFATEKFKVQFARMGEPSLNPAVLDALRKLTELYDPNILYVSLSTIAPANRGAREFFERLIELKNRHYADGRFQLQFSIHTTDTKKRDELIPAPKWTFAEIGEYGERFARTENGDKKITLNFAAISGCKIDTSLLHEFFNPEKFLIKITPLNPTVASQRFGFHSTIDPHNAQTAREIVENFESLGYYVILSIGEPEENSIGSNCGQFVQRALSARGLLREGYELALKQ